MVLQKAGLAYCKVGVLLFVSVLQGAGTSPPRPPRPPRPSLSLVRGPPVFRLRLRRGADLASVGRLVAHGVGLL